MEYLPVKCSSPEGMLRLHATLHFMLYGSEWEKKKTPNRKHFIATDSIDYITQLLQESHKNCRNFIAYKYEMLHLVAPKPQDKMGLCVLKELSILQMYNYLQPCSLCFYRRKSTVCGVVERIAMVGISQNTRHCNKIVCVYRAASIMDGISCAKQLICISLNGPAF